MSQELLTVSTRLQGRRVGNLSLGEWSRGDHLHKLAEVLGKAAGSTPSRDRARVRGPIARDLWGAQPSATRSSPGPCPEGRATASSRREPPAVAGTWPVRTRARRSCCTDGDFTILSLAGARRPVSFGFYGVGSVVCEHGTLHALARIEVHLGSAMVVPRPWTGRRRCS